MAEEPVSLHLPDNVVKGSARAFISISGDLMGMALQNLDDLVQMPHGCGEQNMVLFAPIVYVLQYLEKTRQLTPEIRERETGFLRNGMSSQPPGCTSQSSGTPALELATASTLRFVATSQEGTLLPNSVAAAQ